LLLTQSGHPKGRAGCPLAEPRNYFFPGGLYKLSTLEDLCAPALNSARVQALEVVTSEIVPAAAAPNNAAIADSASLVSVMSRKSLSAVVNKNFTSLPPPPSTSCRTAGSRSSGAASKPFA